MGKFTFALAIICLKLENIMTAKDLNILAELN
jgi:hypothetical protein